jgi:hypothetical protein
MARWAYQWSPHDQYDYDGVNENVLLDLPIDGQQRKVLVRPERNGFVYVLDRATGEVLSADPFVHTTAATGVDLKTGRPIEVEEKKTGFGRVSRDLPGGARRQGLAAVSVLAAHRAAVHPAQQPLHGHGGLEANYIAGTPFVGANVVMYAGPGGHRGEFTAWDPVARKAAGDRGALPGLERRGGHGRRRRLLRHDGPLVQGGARADRRAALAVPGRLRHHRPADHVPRPGRQAVRGDPVGRRRVGRRHRLRRSDPRRTAALGFVGAMTDLPDYTARAARSTCSRCQ